MGKKKHIMIQGTGSGVGKSILVAGLCRLLTNKGYKVAPFKAQNMALNSGVTFDGLEMGRAQILQAEACKMLPDVRMNPILLKPTGKGMSQIIRLGKPYKTVSYRDYYKLYNENLQVVKEAFESLERENDFLVIEGAGSPAEINLQKYDIVNMKMAEIADAKVYIVGDIDRGGIFASFKGTYDLIEEKYKNYIKGFVINKFRGDSSLLEPAFGLFKSYCPIPIKGVIPYFEHCLEDEDSQGLKNSVDKKSAEIKIGVIKLKYLSNFTDFLPLQILDNVMLKYTDDPDDLDSFDAIIIPGSKNSILDMKFLKKKGLFEKIKSLYGKKLIMGICGGFQMLGDEIIDEDGVEDAGNMDGFGFVHMKTLFDREKILRRKEYIASGDYFTGKISGYEIHHGRSIIHDDRVENLLIENGLLIYDRENRVIGTYLHGIFENADFIKFFFKLLNKNVEISKTYFELKEESLEKLASMLEENLWKNIKND
ncbi:cobyric acid synthase [Deferribacter autotrophicus]|uniref:Cobyric acid synthase n=1 Tax=Deferribacter autotrophicus TaxID=500465 RepID=A0A5A8F7K4_9BACT|nr:cobyric acid synthase [Deferribacter autotrophicus]KAA0257846.1 cobyric acid synthase [Deferribacter autotrophicus]